MSSRVPVLSSIHDPQPLRLWLVAVLLAAASKTVRSPRPPYVFLRVGEVVMESKGHMVGVVVSWDPEMRAPQKWIDRVYSLSEVSSGLGFFFVLHKFISYLQEGVKLQLSLFSWPHRASKQRTPLIIKCCSVGTTPPLWLLDICHRRSWSASPGWGYVVKEILTHHQTCLTHHGLTDGCCSRTFPLWRITSHIMTGSGLSCSPGSWSCFPRMRLRTKSCSPGSRSFLKGFFYCTFAVMFGIKLHSILISLLKI